MGGGTDSKNLLAKTKITVYVGGCCVLRAVSWPLQLFFSALIGGRTPSFYRFRFSDLVRKRRTNGSVEERVQESSI
eukprot:scaffold21455_cov116-Cylindrotheca_fusiformis.AAC.13